MRLLPIHAHHRMPVGLREAGVAPVEARTLRPFPFTDVQHPTGIARRAVRLPHKARKLAPGHLMHPYRERLGNRHPVLRAFIIASPGLARRRPHHERLRRHHHQLRAGVTVAEAPPGLQLPPTTFRFRLCLTSGASLGFAPSTLLSLALRLLPCSLFAPWTLRRQMLGGQTLRRSRASTSSRRSRIRVSDGARSTP